MKQSKNDKFYYTCPGCGHDRVQVHDRGRLVYVEGGKPYLEWDEVALQCQKCLKVFTDKEAVLVEGS